MAKYHELLKEYKEDIERIRDAKRAYEAAKAELNEYFKSQGWDNYDFAEEARLDELVQQAHITHHELLQKLTQDIETEYWDVPFEKPRKQGMEKFFELANI